MVEETNKIDKKSVAKKTAPKNKTVVKKSPAKRRHILPPTVEPLIRKLPMIPVTLPVRTFLWWAVGIIIVFSVINTILANIIIAAKYEDMVAEVKDRTAVQASGRADVVSEWLSGQLQVADTLTNSDLMRLFSAEMSGNSSQRGDMESQTLRAALVAQIPYMQQTVKDLVIRHKMSAAYIVNQTGEIFLSSMQNPLLSSSQLRGVKNVFISKHPHVLGMRISQGSLLMDIAKPIIALDDENMDPPVTAVLLMSIPAGEKLSGLLDVGPLAKDGERAFLLQRDGEKSLALVRRGSVSLLEASESDLVSLSVQSPDAFISPVDGTVVFGSLMPIDQTPFRVLQEFNANKALAFIELYRKGVYGMVILATLALIAVALLIIGHLLAQRNRTRVRHQSKTMDALVRAVEIRDPYLAGHHSRVARLSIALGNSLGLPVRQRSTLFYSAMLSGVGKIFVPQSVLSKKGKLTDEERVEMEGHIMHAMSVLRDVEFELPVADVIEQMCERMDGSGYPNKLKGEKINILSRILAVSDSYCAMTRPRAYREALSDEEVMKQLGKSLSQYDEKVFLALVEYLK